jgi:peptidoglycan/xylan/chitin deacetylase (PgdA/CDA1 family)
MELFVLNGVHSRFTRWIARPVARLPLWGPFTAPVRMLAVRIGEHRGRVATSVFFHVRTLEYWRGVEEAGGIPEHSRLRVLAYHAISDLTGRGVLEPYGVPPEQFRSQLEALKRHGYQAINADEMASFAQGTGRLPRRAILLTFDDCYADLLDAAEALQAAHLPAIAFAVSRLVGGENSWDRKHGGQPLQLLDADGLRRVRECGLEVGAHSRTHPPLPALTPADIEGQVRGSVEDLRALGLGPVRFFAYPYGESDRNVRDVVRKLGLTAAFVIDTGVMDLHTDRHLIPRIEVLRADHGRRFIVKVALARQLGWLTPRLRRATTLGRWIAARLT